MATINIGAANADDAFYRYKMPKLVAKIEGRGNGIKTNVVNNVDIAKALERAPEYILKYFGCELGAQVNYDKGSGTSIVNGAHDSKKLSELLEGFIKKYVKCYECGNPETRIKIKKEFLHLKCKACGFVSDVDPRHKLNTFILKNPPENKMSKEEKKLKQAEEERLRDAEIAVLREKKEKNKEKDKKEKSKDKDKKDKKKKKSKDDQEGSPRADGEDDVSEEEDVDEEDDGVVWMTDTSAEATKRRAEEQLTAATAAMVTQGNIEAEEEAARKRIEKEAKRKAEEEERMKEEEAERQRIAEEEVQRLAEEAAQKLALAAAEAEADVTRIRELALGGADAASVAAEVKKLSVSGGLAGKMRVLYEAVLKDRSEKLADLVKANKPLFAAFAKDQPSQLAQLIALEHFLSVTAPERVKETALVLKALYDLDLADEEVIVAWGEKADAGKILNVPADASKAMRKVAQPVVDWLQEDDDEDDE